MKKTLIIFLFITFLGQPAFAENNPNSAYEKGDYQQAVKDYESLIKSGYETPELFYNLGSAYYQLQEYGRAYAFFSKAQTQNPRDSDIQHNLELAKNRLASSTERVPQQNFVGFLNQIVSFQSYLSDSERNLIFIVLFTLLSFFLFLNGLQIHKGQSPKFKISTNLLLILFFCWSFTMFASRPGINGSRVFSLNSQARKIKPAIIIDNQTKIYSGAGKEFQVVSVLDSGTELEALDTKDNWIKIALPAGRVGWVSSNSIEIL